jgi:hypothetical protein
MTGKYKAVNTQGHKYYPIRPKIHYKQMITNHIETEELRPKIP